MRLVRFAGLSEDYGIDYDRSHIWRWERDGKFPKRVRLGPEGGRVAWLRDEIEAWIAARVAERDNAEAA